VRKYQPSARSVKPFYQPGLPVTPRQNLKTERRKDMPNAEKRLAPKNRNNAIVVEVKFAQDTNDSTRRKTSSKLTQLRKDYRKNEVQGHKWIVLVLFEKGKKILSHKRGGAKVSIQRLTGYSTR
jgi:hypothetical protein